MIREAAEPVPATAILPLAHTPFLGPRGQRGALPNRRAATRSPPGGQVPLVQVLPGDDHGQHQSQHSDFFWLAAAFGSVWAVSACATSQHEPPVQQPSSGQQ